MLVIHMNISIWYLKDEISSIKQDMDCKGVIFLSMNVTLDIFPTVKIYIFAGNVNCNKIHSKILYIVYGVALPT